MSSSGTPAAPSPKIAPRPTSGSPCTCKRQLYQDHAASCPSRRTLSLDKQATIAMLAALKDGDKPLGPGDVFHHPQHGAMTVSRVTGWKDMMHFEGHRLVGIRAWTITAFRTGRKKAEKVNFLLPAKKGG